jgi:hypothetical protein
MHAFGFGVQAPLDDPNEMPSCCSIKGNADSMLYRRSNGANCGATTMTVIADSPLRLVELGLAGSNGFFGCRPGR